MRIDKLAYQSRLRRVSPSVKLATACACILICLLTDSLALCAFLTVTQVILVCVPGGTRFKDAAQILSIPVPFIVTGCIAILISFSHNNNGMLCSLRAGGFYIGITENALRLCIHTASKSLACVSCMNALSMTTPVNDLFSLLRRSAIPDTFVEIAELIYRYIFVLQDCAQRIELAQKTRLGYATLKTSYRSAASAIASVFVRAYKQADKTYTALESRGYTGSLATVNRSCAVSARHAAFAAAYVICAAVIGVIFR